MPREEVKQKGQKLCDATYMEFVDNTKPLMQKAQGLGREGGSCCLRASLVGRTEALGLAVVRAAHSVTGSVNYSTSETVHFITQSLRQRKHFLRERKGDVTTEAEVRVIQPEAKGQDLQKLQRQGQVSPGASRRSQTCDTLVWAP